MRNQIKKKKSINNTQTWCNNNPYDSFDRIGGDDDVVDGPRIKLNRFQNWKQNVYFAPMVWCFVEVFLSSKKIISRDLLGSNFFSTILNQ